MSALVLNFKSMAIQEESSIILLLPIQEVFQKVDKCRLIDYALLGKRMKIVRIRKRLHKFELELKARETRIVVLFGRRRWWRAKGNRSVADRARVRRRHAARVGLG